MGDVLADESGIVVACPSCGQKNRLVYRRLGSTHRCGKCRTELSLPAAPVDVVSARAFDALLEAATRPVLVDFWAPWCGPCRAVAPEMARVAERQVGHLIVAKINTEALPELGDRFGIRSIPTMALFHGGREVGRTTGARPAEGILAFVTETLQQV